MLLKVVKTGIFMKIRRKGKSANHETSANPLLKNRGIKA